MSTLLNPYLHFDGGTAREAIEFYAAVFGGELSVMTYGDMGTEGEHATKVMHSQLDHAAVGITIMASDYVQGWGSDELPANGMLSLSGDDGDLLRGWWAALAEGGQVWDELSVKPWGDEFGSLSDKYGVSWVMNIAQPQG
jgi:PhnB protein